MSLQPDDNANLLGTYSSIGCFARWLYDAQSELHLSLFPLKGPVMFEHWSNPGTVQQFGKALMHSRLGLVQLVGDD